MKIRVLLMFVGACSALTACTTLNTAIQTATSLFKSAPAVDTSRFNPDYRYLRITIKGAVAFATLGDIDQHPDGPIEVYYSGGREVIRLQNGHIAGAIGLPTEWRNVSLSAMPPWTSAARASQPVEWTRVRDVMPGYRFGIRDHLALRVIHAPQKSALQDILPDSLTWFENRHRSENSATSVSMRATPDTMLPVARYAVDFSKGQETVVYGEQCLARDLCFTWQRWTVKKPGP